MLSMPSTISSAVSVSSATSASMPASDCTYRGYPLGVRWQILGESERPRVGAFVAIAVAREEMTATLVRDHLRLHGIAANFPPITHIFRLWDGAYIWVHCDDEVEAVRLLHQLQAEWYTEP